MSFKVGDLVMTVRGHKCTLEAVGGIPFVIKTIYAPPDRKGTYNCAKCFSFDVWHNEPAAKFNGANIPFSWLIKIDPPAEGETREAYKELTA